MPEHPPPERQARVVARDKPNEQRQMVSSPGAQVKNPDGENQPLGPLGPSGSLGPLGSLGSSGLPFEQPLPSEPDAPSDPAAPSGQIEDEEAHPPSHNEVFRLAIRLHRGPPLEPDEMLDIVRHEYPKLSPDDIELVATELEEKILKVDPRKQKLPRALEEAEALPPPPEASRYPRRPHLRRFIGLIDVLADEEGVIVIAQEPFAETLGVSRAIVRGMIGRLIKDKLLAIHTPADREAQPFRATTYFWRPDR